MKKIELSHSDFFFKGMETKKLQNNPRTLDFEMLHTFIEENKDSLIEVYAGLAEDWTYTNALVWSKENEYSSKEDATGTSYFASLWATPSIKVVFRNFKEESYECFKTGFEPNSYFKNL